MEKQDFLTTLNIISENHTTKIVINKADGFVGELGKTEFTIHLIDCCASVVDKLKKADYMLSMNKGYLLVHKL